MASTVRSEVTGSAVNITPAVSAATICWHDDGQPNLLEPVLSSISHRPFAKERSPTLADMLENSLFAQVEKAIVKTREGGRGQVFCGGARAHGIGLTRSKSGQNLFGQLGVAEALEGLGRQAEALGEVKPGMRVSSPRLAALPPTRSRLALSISDRS